MRKVTIAGLLAISLVQTGCIRLIADGEVAVVRSMGDIDDRERTEPGLYISIPLLRSFSITSVKTRETSNSIEVPARSGLIVGIDVSTLWHYDPSLLAELAQSVQGSPEKTLLSPYLRNVIRDVVSSYDVDAIYGKAGRAGIADKALTSLISELSPRGIVIEKILLRDIRLPEAFRASIDKKMAAEQEAIAKEFELLKAKKDAEIEIARAHGAAESQRIINATLTTAYLHYRWIETLGEKDVIYVATEAALPIFKKLDR